MHWKSCTASTYQSPPTARVGHVSLAVDAREAWGEELLLIIGGLSEDKQALGDVSVYQVGTCSPDLSSPDLSLLHHGC